MLVLGFGFSFQTFSAHPRRRYGWCGSIFSLTQLLLLTNQNDDDEDYEDDDDVVEDVYGVICFYFAARQRASRYIQYILALWLLT